MFLSDLTIVLFAFFLLLQSKSITKFLFAFKSLKLNFNLSNHTIPVDRYNFYQVESVHLQISYQIVIQAMDSILGRSICVGNNTLTNTRERFKFELVLLI